MASYTLEELAGSPTVTVDRKGAKGTRVFKIAWDDRYAPFADLIPDPYLSGNDIIIPPAATFPGLETLVVDSIKVDPMFPDIMRGNNNFPAEYNDAKLTVEYRTLDYNQKESQNQPSGPGGAAGSTGSPGAPAGPSSPQSKTFITHKITTSAEFLTWPNGCLAYDGTADPGASGQPGAQAKVPEDQKFGILMPMVEHSIQWHFVPYPPWAAIRWLMGNVNAYWFAGAAPETLLFAGCEADREITSQGIQMWKMTYKFLEKNSNQLDPQAACGWNHFLRTNGWNNGTFQIVNRKAPGAYTTLASAMSAASALGDSLPVRSRSGWPSRNPVGMYVKIEDEVLQIDVTQNPFVVLARGSLGSTAVIHPAGAVVQSVQVMNNVGLVGNTLSCSNTPAGNVGFAFPKVGQMFLNVGNEKLVVVRRNGSSNVFGVLRSVRGTSMSSGSYAYLADMPVYPLGDFRYLFLSGLVTF